ncbi:MAG: hypothetical protein ACYCYE_02925 [Clostridia bacterium]
MELAINNGVMIDPKNKVHSKLNIAVNNGKPAFRQVNKKVTIKAQ